MTSVGLTGTPDSVRPAGRRASGRRALFAALLAVAWLLLLAAPGCKLRRRSTAVADGGTPAAPPPVAVSAPPGYVEARVLDVSPTPAGAAVTLIVDKDHVALPIFVGGTEAMTIQLRMEGKHYVRPLTHDLLSDTIRELGGRAVKVQVDELRSDTFIGSAYLERPDGSIAGMDARPSDCIALALGAGVPIYVNRAVLAAAGVPTSTLGGVGGGGGGRPGRGDPLHL